MAGSGSVASSGLNHAAMLMGQLQGHYSDDTAAAHLPLLRTRQQHPPSPAVPTTAAEVAREEARVQRRVLMDCCIKGGRTCGRSVAGHRWFVRGSPIAVLGRHGVDECTGIRVGSELMMTAARSNADPA